MNITNSSPNFMGRLIQVSADKYDGVIDSADIVTVKPWNNGQTAIIYKDYKPDRSTIKSEFISKDYTSTCEAVSEAKSTSGGVVNLYA